MNNNQYNQYYSNNINNDDNYDVINSYSTNSRHDIFYPEETFTQYTKESPNLNNENLYEK